MRTRSSPHEANQSGGRKRFVPRCHIVRMPECRIAHRSDGEVGLVELPAEECLSEAIDVREKHSPSSIVGPL